MQPVGKQGGYEVKLGGLSSTPPELVVEFLGHCQSVGNCNFTHSQKFQSIADTWTPRQVPISQAAKSCSNDSLGMRMGSPFFCHGDTHA
jgi:hypothetical protein